MKKLLVLLLMLVLSLTAWPQAHSQPAASPTATPATQPRSTVDFWTLFFGITSVIGTGLTVYYGLKASSLDKQLRTLEWVDLLSAANDLGAEINKAFVPDLILTPGLRGATFANLLMPELNKEPPVFVGISSWKTNANPIRVCKSYFLVETNKWYVHIPECVLGYKDKCILVVDDFAMSGDFIERIIIALVEHGFVRTNIKSACIVTTKIAIDNHKAPDYFWMDTSNHKFYFPCGKAK